MKKYRKTIFGCSFLLGILLISLLYPLYGPADFDKVYFLYDEKGDLVGVPPIPPSSFYLLGTDRNGSSMLLMILYGAKFTILIALCVTLFRILIGGILGIIFSLWLKPLLLVVKDYLMVYKLIPPIIITIVLMNRVSFYMEDAIYGIMLY
jgi:peptide/nickel transport system permease protein